VRSEGEGFALSSAPAIRFLKDAEGNRVAYAAHGAGPLIVCPAWWVSHLEKDWEDPDFRNFFTTLARGFTVVRYDRPGVGLSDRDASPRSLAAETRLLGDLIDHLGADRVSLFCVSCGGPPGIRFAADQPERVERIVFANSFVFGSDLGPPALRSALTALVRAHWGMGSKALADVFFPDCDGDTIARFSRAQRERSDVDRAAELLELTFAMDARDAVNRVRAPALVIHRRGDRACPFEAGRHIAAELPGATFVPREGRMHLPWVAGSSISEIAVAFFKGESVAAADGAVPRREDSPRPRAAPVFLDVDNRALRIDGDSVRLTPLEFGVMRRLTERPGVVVTRDELLEHVWKQPFAGSNKVEAVVRTLRKKLGGHAAAIETVTGHGYRYRAPAAPSTADVSD
jgi:pimeloyl-ACP methyl ester carboxylesterase/DNA-binding winged helix-turn-helix (wHTH) protein